MWLVVIQHPKPENRIGVITVACFQVAHSCPQGLMAWPEMEIHFSDSWHPDYHLLKVKTKFFTKWGELRWFVENAVS